MPKLQVLITAATAAIGFALSPAAVADATITPVMLESVVVTPTANYSLTQWKAQREARETIVAVMLEPVIVTQRAHYTLAQWQQRQAGLAYARRDEQPRKNLSGWLLAIWRSFVFKPTLIEV